VGEVPGDTDVKLNVAASATDLAALADPWDELARRFAKTPFQTYQWASTWWRLVGCFQHRLALHVVTFHAHGRVVGIAPFMIRNEAHRVTRFLSDPWNDYGDVLIDTAQLDMDTAAVRLRCHLRAGIGTEWDAVVLDECAPWSQFAASFEATGAVAEQASVCPRLSLDDPQAVAHATNRREYARKQRRLRSLGDVQVMLHMTVDAIQRRMPDFVAMHLRQWMGRPDRGLTFDDPEMLRFYFGMVDAFAPSGLLGLIELSLGDAPIAYHLGFVHDDTFWGYRTTYETRFRTFSPGHVMHHEIIPELARNGFRVFDFMRGDTPYKFAYCNIAENNRRYIV
jgi:CelD/BcsL family acetyltransferase involved in cellulose biosynthesis